MVAIFEYRKETYQSIKEMPMMMENEIAMKSSA
jgi:hypothetical protein